MFLTAQLGGAVGSLASLQNQGTAVVQLFAAQLQLSVPSCTWHGERESYCRSGECSRNRTGSQQMARDWSLMMQTEIAEVSEPTEKGRGGSSNYAA